MNLFDDLGVRKEADAVLAGCRKVRGHLLPVSIAFSAVMIRTEWVDSPRAYARLGESMFFPEGNHANDVSQLILWHDTMNALKMGDGKAERKILTDTLADIADFCRAVRQKLAI